MHKNIKIIKHALLSKILLLIIYHCYKYIDHMQKYTAPTVSKF